MLIHCSGAVNNNIRFLPCIYYMDKSTVTGLYSNLGRILYLLSIVSFIPVLGYPDISIAPNYKEKDGELRDFLEKLNHCLITSKDKKLLQDQTAFFMRRAFRWAQPPIFNRKGNPYVFRSPHNQVISR